MGGKLTFVRSPSSFLPPPRWIPPLPLWIPPLPCRCGSTFFVSDENKSRIARSGALNPLTRLAKSKDMRVQRNATGALLNMTHSDENRQQLVAAGAIPVLVSLLGSSDTDVQYYCTTALSNIAVDADNRRKLQQSEPRLVANLIALMDSPSLKVQCQAALALRNLASDGEYPSLACSGAVQYDGRGGLSSRRAAARSSECVGELTLPRPSSPSPHHFAPRVTNNASPSPLSSHNPPPARAEKYQVEIVKNGGLPALLRLLRSSFLPLVLSAAACVRNVSIHPANESPIIESGFLAPLIDLLAYDENEEVQVRPVELPRVRLADPSSPAQCHAISTLRNLAASSESNKRALVDAGAAERIRDLVLQVPVAVQSEMTACAAVLGLSGACEATFLGTWRGNEADLCIFRFLFDFDSLATSPSSLR